MSTNINARRFSSKASHMSHAVLWRCVLGSHCRDRLRFAGDDFGRQPWLGIPSDFPEPQARAASAGTSSAGGGRSAPRVKRATAYMPANTVSSSRPSPHQGRAVWLSP